MKNNKHGLPVLSEAEEDKKYNKWRGVEKKKEAEEREEHLKLQKELGK